MAEHGVETPVIAVIFDGTGLGDDGTIWGGEFLVCDLQSYTRAAYLRPVKLQGGDLAVKEPWRMALSFLYDSDSENAADRFFSLQLPGISSESVEWSIAALRQSINSPPTSSMGRLFDTVAAITGLCTDASYDAEGAMLLEARVGEVTRDRVYPWEGGRQIDTRPIIRAIMDDIGKKTPVQDIANSFHTTIIDMVAGTCHNLFCETGIKTVVLSGGCFQNRIIFEGCLRRLERDGFSVLSHCRVPCNDGGIAVGQLVAAAWQRRA
jgi:hydrogenase maturation protein HypF